MYLSCLSRKMPLNYFHREFDLVLFWVLLMGSEPSKTPPPPPPNPLYAEPWRKYGKKALWMEEMLTYLKKEIQEYEFLQEANVEFCNVLLVGQISAGKSSFFNTVASAFKGKVRQQAAAGFADRSLTTQYRMYPVKSGNQNLRFCDSMGLEGEDSGLSVTDVAFIMEGHVKDRAELGKGVTPAMEGYKGGGYNPNPELKDKIHCVAFVIDAWSVSSLDDKLKAKIKQIRLEANKRDLNPLFMLTHVDEICEESKKDIGKVFHSRAVHKKVQEVSQKFGINENMVFPVKNYNTESMNVLEIDILMLLTVRQILRNSEDYFEGL